MGDEAHARDAILGLLRQRDPGKTICPSEAAREVGGERYRELMPAVRGAAGRLADEGVVDVTQGGQVVDVDSARGPIRLRLREPR